MSYLNLNFKSFILNSINNDYLASNLATICAFATIIGKVICGV